MEIKELILKKGLKVNLPTLAEGELGYTTDDKKLYIGDGTNNINLSESIILTTSDDNVKDKSKIYSVNGELKYLKNDKVTPVNNTVKIESEGNVNRSVGIYSIKVYCSSKFNSNISSYVVTINDSEDEYTLKISSPSTGSVKWTYNGVSTDYKYIILQAQVTTAITTEGPITITIPKYFLMFANEDCTCSLYSGYYNTKYLCTVYDSSYYAFQGDTTTISANASLTSGMNNKYILKNKTSMLPTNITRPGYKLKYYTTSDYTTEITNYDITSDTTAYIKWAIDSDNNWFTPYTPTALSSLKVTDSTHSDTTKQNLSYSEVKLPAKNVIVPSADPTVSNNISAVKSVTLDHNFAIAQFKVTGTLIENLRNYYSSWLPTSTTTISSSLTNTYVKGIKMLSGDESRGQNCDPVVLIPIQSMILVCNAMTDYYNYFRATGESKLTHAYNLNGVPITSWDNAKTFVNSWVNAVGVHHYTEGSTGFRLPTLDEWEYAAKVIPTGTRTSTISCDVVKSSYPQYQYYKQVSGSSINYADSTTFFTDLSNYSWYRSNSVDSSQGRHTSNVGLKLSNNIGLYDMSGIVNEWLDEYSYTENGYIYYCCPGITFLGGDDTDNVVNYITTQSIDAAYKYIGFRIVRTI